MIAEECPLVLNPNPDGPPRHYNATSIEDSYHQSVSTEGFHSILVQPLIQIGEQREQLDEQPKLSYKAKFASFLFKLIVFLLVLVSAALSKVCFVNIAAQLNANSSVGQGSGREKRRSVAFVQLVLVLCVPQAVTILKTLFLGILGKTTKHFPWPSKPALLKVCVSKRASGQCAQAYIL